ncbi:hypothetical protein D3C87_2162420 [compost metagenome]
MAFEIEPVARHAERRAIPLLHAEKRRQKIDHHSRIAGVDVDMIEIRHRPLPRFSARGILT